MSSKIYHTRDSYPRLETTPLSSEFSKLDPLRLPQLVEGVQSASVNQQINIGLLGIDRTFTVRSWKHQLKIARYSPQRVEAIFDKLNNYPILLPSNQIDLAIEKTHRRIVSLGADNETYRYTLEWLKRLRVIVTTKQVWWSEPLVNLGMNSEIVFEWWHENKKLTIYIFGNTAEYIKVWGADIDSEMEDGSATSSAEIKDLWKWLVS